MDRTVTFIHTADLHLDAPFQGVEALDERVASALVGATYETWNRIVELALERHVDFVIVAGDAFNSRDKSLRAQLRFRASLARLSEAGIHVFIAQGNHDPANGWSAGLEMPQGVTHFPAGAVGRETVARDGETVCAVYGRSYAKSAETENLARTFERQAGDPLAVAVLHANVGGNTDHEPYAPCSLEDLRSVGMDYWALGHIHKAQVLAEDPSVVYPGSPQGLNPKEVGAHGCYVVQLSEGRARAEFVDTASVLWHRESVDVSECADLEGIRLAIEGTCRMLRERSDRPSIARLELTSRSPAHGALARPGVLGQLVDEMRDEQLAEDPWLWIDRVRDASRASIDLDRVRHGADFAADLVAVADTLMADEESARALVDEISDPVSVTLGGYAPAEDPVAMLARARDICLDLVLPEEDER